MNVYNIRFIMPLGYSSVNSNMILQPNIPGGGANPSNAHFTNSFGSIVGGTTGCGSDGGSAASLAGYPGYNIVQKGGSSKRRSHKRSLSKRDEYDRKHWWMLKGGNKRSSKRSGNKRSGNKRSGNKRSSKRSGNKRSSRSKRGGLSAMSPAPFSGGANESYNQFTGGAPLSFNYAIGGSRTPLPLAQIGLANNNMTNIHNSCSKSDYGLLRLIQGK